MRDKQEFRSASESGPRRPVPRALTFSGGAQRRQPSRGKPPCAGPARRRGCSHVRLQPGPEGPAGPSDLGPPARRGTGAGCRLRRTILPTDHARRPARAACDFSSGPRADRGRARASNTGGWGERQTGCRLGRRRVLGAAVRFGPGAVGVRAGSPGRLNVRDGGGDWDSVLCVARGGVPRRDGDLRIVV